MASVTCPGLPAHWLNGWLAAVGITVLDSRIRLHWTTDGSPVAVLSTEEIDPIAAVVESWPDDALLKNLPIAENWNDASQLQRKVAVETFEERAAAARGEPYSWALSSTMTDLCIDEDGKVAHAPFDPTGTGPMKWLHHRLVKTHEQVAFSVKRLEDSLAGRAARIKSAGLGFDLTRLGTLSDDTSKWIDPVVEVLTFFSLFILPVRGDGTHQVPSRSPAARARQRGWLRMPSERDRCFVWPAWRQPLECDGVDALLDVWHPTQKGEWSRIGVHAAWRSIEFKRKGSSDVTKAFGSERL